MLARWWESVQANPILLTEAARQVLYVALAFEILRWTDAQLAIVLSALSAVLALLTRGAVTSNSRVEQKVQEQVIHREVQGLTGTGDGMTPPKQMGIPDKVDVHHHLGDPDE